MTLLDTPPTATSRPSLRHTRIADLYRQLLSELGEDPDREGLKGTPERVAAWWAEFLEHDPGRTDTVFEQELAGDADRLLVVRGITAWSLCEHHLLPMRLDFTLGYLPADQVLGLSKFARIVAAHTHRLQLQERIVDGVAADLTKATGTADVGVVAEGEHLCMSMRGVREPTARTINYSLTGCFSDQGVAGSRLLALATSGAGR
ncbi:GTP cyclohydrolase I [Streptomyces sp. NPDC058471]|uniref:GTP cyclohydrolase I n=1 Tax=Streptomyces sp. NPDC058471 TaxID=3346516 RepID=UPI00365B8C36